jgi:hypothetical protein
MHKTKIFMPCKNLLVIFLRDSVTGFFASGFFRESSSHKPLIIALGSIWIFSKIFGDICKSRCTMTLAAHPPEANLPPIPLVSLISVENLPPVSTTSVANYRNTIRLLTP